MPTVSQPYTMPLPVPSHDVCPAGCTLSEMLQCWLRYEREIRADLLAATASGSPDAEVLASDLRSAEEHTDRLLALARGHAA